ncbi:MAG: hypothetical protein J5725_06555 [Bacteroidales bacterium]|nr:hypothetical protein [Bacteroidales bacterium]
MSANNGQFVQTKKLFRDYLSGYPKNPTFEEWRDADPDDKAALLFVTFYQEITLAWYNAVVSKGVIYVSQEDGVSTVLQYLMKNVTYISGDSKRYTPEYIYTVAYKCLLSLWQTRKTDRLRSDLEVPNIWDVSAESTIQHPNLSSTGTVNLWDLVPSDDDDYETQQVKEAIWNVIHHMGPKAEKVVNHLINPKDTIHRVAASSPERPTDRLADVSVSKAEYNEILEELKVKLAPYKDVLFTL